MLVWLGIGRTSSVVMAVLLCFFPVVLSVATGLTLDQGRASYTMQFDSYAEVPRNVAEEIIKKARGE